MSSTTLNGATNAPEKVDKMSLSPGQRDDSRTNTLVPSENGADAEGDAERQEKKPRQLEPGASDEAHHQHPLAQLGQARKNFLLLIFSIASFVDVCNVSGVAVAVAQISADIGLDLSQIVWVSDKAHPTCKGADRLDRSSRRTRSASLRFSSSPADSPTYSRPRSSSKVVSSPWASSPSSPHSSPRTSLASSSSVVSAVSAAL
jgi:hypothetical protein